MHDFIVFYEDIEDKTISELFALVLEKKKIAIRDLKFVDLIYNNKSMIGVYMFFDKSNYPVYIGKTGSRTIMERIAGHLDLRGFAFMNSFLCALSGKRKQRKGPNATSEELSNVFERAIEYKMIFIQLPDNIEKTKIGLLERYLQKKFQPIYNQNKSKIQISENIKISEI